MVELDAGSGRAGRRSRRCARRAPAARRRGRPARASRRPRRSAHPIAPRREVVVDEVGVRVDDRELARASCSRTGSSRRSRRRSGTVVSSAETVPERRRLVRELPVRLQDAREARGRRPARRPGRRLPRGRRARSGRRSSPCSRRTCRPTTSPGLPELVERTGATAYLPAGAGVEFDARRARRRRASSSSATRS